MEKIVTIGNQEVKFRSSAALPHMYRRKFQRDIFLDMEDLRKNLTKNKDGSSSLSITSLEMFENLAWCFARHADPNVPDDIEEWLAQFETFDIYVLLPELMSMWNTEQLSTSSLKKKNGKSTVK